MVDERADGRELQPSLDPSFFELEADDVPFVFDSGESREQETLALRNDIIRHLEALKLPSWAGLGGAGSLSKDAIRAIHASQRQDVLRRELAVLRPRLDLLLQQFANGRDVRPQEIDPVLEPVRSDTPSSELFRLATLLWSVPVSKGYGRRMRYLVRDRSNGKLIGVFALTDPVFNLRARDEWIGWTVEQRRASLVHLMDAYVVGAVPPYSQILGGKLVVSLIASSDVGEEFARRYAETEGIISKKQKAARLVLVTVTSALGRSSLYNRVRLQATDATGRSRAAVELIRVGATEGYGHFQLSESLFRRLRELVESNGHIYANGHRYGQGPNWRIRVSRVGLGMLGLDPDLLRHGIARDIYTMPLASNYRDFLCRRDDEALLDRPSVREIASAALRRWVVPRSERFPDFRQFELAQLGEELRRL